MTVSLYHPSFGGRPVKQKTSHYHPHMQLSAKFLGRGEQPPAIHPIWDQVLEWDAIDAAPGAHSGGQGAGGEEMTFLRVLIKSDDKFAKNPVFAVTSLRLCNRQEGWVFWRLLDLRGKETHSTICVKVEVANE